MNRDSEKLKWILIFAFGFMLTTVHAHGQPTPNIDDNSISMAVDAALLRDDRVAAHLVDTQTTDGVVTLSGSVDSLLARDRAVQVTETIKGVRSIINRIEVIPEQRTDSVILGDIKKALTRDPATDAYEVTTRVKDGKVTLSGTVDSWAEKQLAAQVVKGVKGVVDIENNIELLYKSRRPDAEIKPEVEQRLAFDPYVNDTLIDVSVDQGKVHLKGSVGSPAERTNAYVDAFVQGVYQVNIAELIVEPWLDNQMVKNKKVDFHTDAQVEQAIKDALLYDPRVYMFNIDVESVNGRVSLTGTVDNLMAKRAAEQDAKNTLGVYEVVNRVKVRPADLHPDKELLIQIRDALLVDPYVDRFDIKVMARNGKVYLYGDVDTFYQKDRAEDLAARTDGVISVENKLEVLTRWDWKSDRQITKDIEEELFWSMLVDSDTIEVEVEEGVATLKGQADSWQELDAAIENAFEGGAKAVRSRIKLDKGGDYYPVYHHRDYHKGARDNGWNVGWYTQV